MTVRRALIRDLRARLSEAAVPADAGPMQAYMKSAMPYYGVKKPVRAKISKAVIDAHPLADYEDWRDTAAALYAGAKRREERYCALDLVGHRRHRAFRDRWTSFELYEAFIVEGAWWDLVDETAAHHLGALMDHHTAACTRKMRAWIADENLWRRRSAIICQLKRKGNTDRELLAESILGAIDSSEFFLRKAIGWALREFGKSEPQWVIAFVREHEARLSGLSRREALRRLIADGLVES